MLNIKVLGPGCANCKRLEQITQKAVDTLSVPAQIEKVTDYGEIMAFGVLSTPGLVVNGQVVSYGRLPSLAEVTGWLVDSIE
ncbi:MAG: TM0996/MTH895 family glutaredoxin-like protein [Ardenticatenaceae bacterium]|nr:TM0996/MTH895 family glutaredoxin-like protein [Anaerolineales bacterium]MCB8920017.1 TM0996/MTH895 family glutaredoxin-like protein [Ardenticatenaceae bacterium]MCB8989862.1 TM0996/MTH895 family glutaredoxin-like protein [Ardenticatenaceae bacterium]